MGGWSTPAICDRPALCTQTNNTDGFDVDADTSDFVLMVLLERCGVQEANETPCD
jgi:hypothetical protein